MNASMAQGASLSRCRSEANSVAMQALFLPGLCGLALSVGGVGGGRRRQASPAGVGAASGAVDGGAAASISIFWITTGCRGASSLNGPWGPVGDTLMRSMTSMPSTMRPNTA